MSRFFKLCIAASIFCTSAEIATKITKDEAQMNQEIDGFLEIALLRESTQATSLKSVITKAPFEWPVQINFIKQVLFFETNKVKIELKKITSIGAIHKGMVIAVNAGEKYIWIQHVIEGGTCYISIFENVENIKLKLGDVIQKGDKIGDSSSVTMHIIQPHCTKKTDIKPSIQLLFSVLPPNLIKIVKQVKCTVSYNNCEDIEDRNAKQILLHE